MKNPSEPGARAAFGCFGLWMLCWVLFSTGLRAEILPSFELLNWDGRKVSTDSLKGKTTILVFTYARCVFACPMVTFLLKDLDREMKSPQGLSFLHISVNPALDTAAEILKHFKKHDIDPKEDQRWLFLNGPERGIARTLEQFGIEVKRTSLEAGVLVEHTIKVLVVGPEGRPVKTFDTYLWDEEEMFHALRKSLEQS